MSQLVEQLQHLGFSQYEAQAYITLLQHEPLNGYELAKHSGIPRPSIYPVIQKLEERGAVLRMESENAVRYAALPPEQLLAGLGRQYRESLEAAERSLSELSVRKEDEHLWNVRGYPVFIEQARALIESAREKLMVAISPVEAAVLAEEMRGAERRGVAITTLCLAECSKECGGCRGRIHRFPVAPEPQGRWLILAQDEQELLAGEIRASAKPDEGGITASSATEGEDIDTNAVRTRQKLLVNLALWYIRQSIALAALLQEEGRAQNLAPETRALLSSLDVSGAKPSWTQRWRSFLEKSGTVEDSN